MKVSILPSITPMHGIKYILMDKYNKTGKKQIRLIHHDVCPVHNLPQNIFSLIHNLLIQRAVLKQHIIVFFKHGLIPLRHLILLRLQQAMYFSILVNKTPENQKTWKINDVDLLCRILLEMHFYC